jgi:hypothetical protein
MKQELINQVKDLVGEDGNLYFASSLLVKITPHTWPVQIWAVSVKENRIALMDGLQNWFELEETDKNYSVVLATLYQRIQTIYKLSKTA